MRTRAPCRARDPKSGVEDLLENRNNSESYRDGSVGVLGGSGGYWDALGVLLASARLLPRTRDCRNPPRGCELQMAVSAAPILTMRPRLALGCARRGLMPRCVAPHSYGRASGPRNREKRANAQESARRRPTQPASRGTSQRDPRPTLAPACAGHGPMPVRPKPAHTRRARAAEKVRKWLGGAGRARGSVRMIF